MAALDKARGQSSRGREEVGGGKVEVGLRREENLGRARVSMLRPCVKKKERKPLLSYSEMMESAMSIFEVEQHRADYSAWKVANRRSHPWSPAQFLPGSPTQPRHRLASAQHSDPSASQPVPHCCPRHHDMTRWLKPRKVIGDPLGASLGCSLSMTARSQSSSRRQHHRLEACTRRQGGGSGGEHSGCSH
eukprot:3941227-Rhodomonas_salina.2